MAKERDCSQEFKMKQDELYASQGCLLMHLSLFVYGVTQDVCHLSSCLQFSPFDSWAYGILASEGEKLVNILPLAAR